MFQSAGLFKDVSCPYFLYGLCERPHCHFKHSKQEEAKARKEADAGKKETESNEGYSLPTSSLQRTLQAIEDNIKSEKQKLSTKDEPGEENKVIKSDKKPLKNKPTGTPEYNPTPIQELKKKEIEGKLGRSKYDLALLEKPETDSEYDPECNFSTNGNTGHTGEGSVPDYAKSLHGVKRTVDENDEDGSPLAKIPKFLSVDYTPSVITTEVSDDEPIGEKEDWFSENESHNSNDSGNIESSEEKPKDRGNADETPTESNSLPIEFTPEGFVKYIPTKIDNKKKDSKGDAKSGKPSLNGSDFSNDSKEKDTKKESDITHTKGKDPCSYNIFSLFKNEFDKVFENSESSKDNDKTSDKSHKKNSENDSKNEKKSKDSHSEKHINNHKHQSKDKSDSHSSGSKHRSSSKEKSVTSNHGSSSSKHSSSSSKSSSSSSKSSSSSSKENGSSSKHPSSKHSSSSSKHSSSLSRQRSSSSKHSSSKHSSLSSKDTRPSSSSSSSKHDKHTNSKLERHDGSKSSSGKNHRESDSRENDSKKLSKPSTKSIVNLDVDLFGEDVLDMSNNHYDDDDMSDLEKYFEEDPFEECLRIFNEDKNNGSAKSDKKKMKKSSSTVEDAPPPVVVGKKRIALKENEDKAKRQKVDDKPKPKPSPAQVMMNRYKMMQERALQAEQERKEKVKAKVKEMQAGRMANPPPPVAGPSIAGSISTFTTYMNNKNKKTAAITVAKGAKRKAHTPTVEIEKLKRPTVEMTSSTKVPANVRQRYLNLFIDECLKLCRTEQEAYDKGKAEEEAAFNRCSNKKIYLNIVVHTIKRLRTEIEEKKARKSAPKKETKLSHAAMLGGAHAKNTSFTLNRSGGAVKLREEDFKDAELYNRLKSYILTEEQLNMNNFPRPDPAKGGCAVYLGEVNNAQKGSVKGYEKICIRCGKRFEVYPNGKYPKKEECVYHWGKAWKKKVAGTIDTRYTCCSGDLSAEGCQVARAHVHETNKKENLSGFMKTIPCSPPIDGDYGVYAMDCEMVYTTMGMELARVTVVDGEGEVAYESLVQPDNPVVDCNTRFSGITDEDLEDVSTSLRDVQAVLLSLFTDKTILLGHSLESDLTAVKLIHSTVVDTSIVFPHRMGLPYKRALRNLMIEYLKKIIQDDVAGHDSHEDALACLQLMQYKLKEDDRKEARRLSN